MKIYQSNAVSDKIHNDYIYLCIGTHNIDEDN
jgi:hypothetical protein